jgi:hypothetical protein
MGYYAQGDGSIGFFRSLDDAEADAVADLLHGEFEDAEFASDGKSVSFWTSDKYHSDAVLDILDRLSKEYPVADGCVEYSGEDGCHWRFRLVHPVEDSESIMSDWIEEDGFVSYESDRAFVYVLEHRWDTEDGEGSEVRVYANDCIDTARRDMHIMEDQVREEYRARYGKDPWEEDYTWSSDNAVHLGFETRNGSHVVNYYSWEITAQGVIGI